MNDTPFLDTLTVRPLGDGTYVADLHPDWAVGDRPHGGHLLALLSRAAVGETSLEPLSVSAQFLRPPKVGPVLLRTERLKVGRTVTAVRAVLEQAGQPCVDATLTLGTVPDEQPAWSDLPDMPVNPPPDAVDLASADSGQPGGLAKACDMRLDPRGAGFLHGSTEGPLRLRMWARPHQGQPDLLFALVAGDLTMPVTFNLGRFGWSPTVQLTALLRARPANGWLRLVVESKAVHGQWFDEDTLVIDSTGRLVCQARQLALSTP
ncbi:thioesterase family protein [Saccharopolyspora sp. MS10]|uniref:thioesterase family protein n=1 Tax=Saccharopolyspora sp. MS10 TaxID=3385973 RepID=UPI0039A23A30